MLAEKRTRSRALMTYLLGRDRNPYSVTVRRASANERRCGHSSVQKRAPKRILVGERPTRKVIERDVGGRERIRLGRWGSSRVVKYSGVQADAFASTRESVVNRLSEDESTPAVAVSGL